MSIGTFFPLNFKDRVTINRLNSTVYKNVLFVPYCRDIIPIITSNKYAIFTDLENNLAFFFRPVNHKIYISHEKLQNLFMKYAKGREPDSTEFQHIHLLLQAIEHGFFVDRVRACAKNDEVVLRQQGMGRQFIRMQIAAIQSVPRVRLG